MGELSSKYEGSNDHIRQLFKEYIKSMLIEFAHAVSNTLQIGELIEFQRNNKADASIHSITKDIQKCSILLKKHLSFYMRDMFVEHWMATNSFSSWVLSMDIGIKNLGADTGVVKNTTVIYENGDKYTGMLNCGIKHGEGTLYEYLTGFTYIGCWKNDKKEGTGQYINEKQGYIYEGSWENNLKNGNGKLYTPAFQYSGSFLKYCFYQ